jgi:hypothetical protein
MLLHKISQTRPKLVYNTEFIEVWKVTSKRFIIQCVFHKKEMQSLKEHIVCLI